MIQQDSKYKYKQQQESGCQNPFQNFGMWSLTDKVLMKVLKMLSFPSFCQFVLFYLIQLFEDTNFKQQKG